MRPALILFGSALGFALYALAQRADDPASADDPELVQSAERVASGLVAALGRSVSDLWTPPAAADAWRETIAQAETRYGLPANLLLRQLDIESNHFDRDV